MSDLNKEDIELLNGNISKPLNTARLIIIHIYMPITRVYCIFRKLSFIAEQLYPKINIGVHITKFKNGKLNSYIHNFEYFLVQFLAHLFEF